MAQSNKTFLQDHNIYAKLTSNKYKFQIGAKNILILVYL